MPVEIITKDDLREFKEELLQEFKAMLLALGQRTAATEQTALLDSLPDRLKSRDIRQLFGISSVTVWKWEGKKILNPNVISGRKYYAKKDILKLLHKKNKKAQ